MLQNIRDKATGWLAYAIVGLITIPFLFWGIQSYLGAGGAVNVATVNGAEISVQEFQRALQQQQRQLREMFGGKVPAGLAEGSEIKQSVLGDLVQTELLRQVTREYGWRVSDMSVADEIKSSPQFQVDGKFSAKRYEQLIASQRISKATYESFIREQMQLEQMRKAVNDGGFLVAADKKRFLELQGQKRRIDYLVLDKDKFKSEVTVSDEDIADYYEKNKAAFMTEEKVKLQYLELDREKLGAGIPVDEATISSIYEQEKEQFKTPETRKASHILFKVNQSTTDEEKKKIAEEAEAVYQQLQENGDFSALAKKYSGDKLSKDKGGDLGLISRGDMPKKFEDTLFSLAENEISRPVLTAQGYEIIKLESIQGGEQQSFETVKDQIVADYRAREVEAKFTDLTDQLVTMTYENPESLDAAAEELQLEIAESDWITRAAPKGIAKDGKVLRAAFSDDVLQKKQNSELIEMENGKVIVIHLAEHQPSRPKPLAEVKSEINKLLLDRQIAEKLRKVGEEKLKALQQGGGDLASLAAELGGEVKSAEAGRQDKKLPPALLQNVFRMPAPKEGAVAYQGIPLSGGGYALVGLKKIQNPEISDEALQTNPQLAQLLGEYNQRFYDAFYQALESRQDIEVFREQLQ